MNPQSIIKPVVLTSLEVGTSWAALSALNSIAMKVMPNMTEWNEEWSNKEKALQVTKVLGVVVVTSIAAGAIANVVSNTVEGIFWSDEEIVEEEPPF